MCVCVWWHAWVLRGRFEISHAVRYALVGKIYFLSLQASELSLARLPSESSASRRTPLPGQCGSRPCQRASSRNPDDLGSFAHHWMRSKTPGTCTGVLYSSR